MFDSIHRWSLLKITKMDLLSFYFHEDEPTVWARLCACFDAWLAWVLPLAATLYWCIFFTLLLVATVGRKLKLRRFYIEVLNRLFSVAAVKMDEEVTKEKMKRRLSFMEEYENSDDESEVEEVDQRSNDSYWKDSDERYKENYKDFLHNETLNTINTFDGSVKRSRSLDSSWEQLSSQADGEREPLLSEKSFVDKVVCCCQKTCETHPEMSNADEQFSTDSKLQEPNSASSHFDENLDNSTQQVGRSCCPECGSTTPDQTIPRFPLDAPMLYISAGVRAILDDCVNSSFSPEQLKTWNLLSRTIQHKAMIRNNKSLAVFFLCGLFVRYVFLMPMRVLVLILSLANLTCCTFLVGCLPPGPVKRTINSYVVSWGFDFVAGSLSVVARFHNKENRPHQGIAVANHTSPIDGMVLATDNCYDMVGQKTKGLLGMFMNALAKSSGHIWFDRSEARDRQATTRLLFEHTQREGLPPILIFPEGVCVNNTAVLEFRKGAFEVDCDIYPVAVRFDPVYGDAFWYEGGFASYCFSMMTSWAIVCDVFYLPPMRKGPDESASHFANRVRSVIAKKVGLVELEWNSMVKMCIFNAEKWQRLKEERQMEQQKQFARSLSLTELL